MPKTNTPKYPKNTNGWWIAKLSKQMRQEILDEVLKTTGISTDRFIKRTSTSLHNMINYNLTWALTAREHKFWCNLYDAAKETSDMTREAQAKIISKEYSELIQHHAQKK